MSADARSLEQIVRGLPASHPARRHARRLAMSLDLGGELGFAELLQTAAWHFAAWSLAQDPKGLIVYRSGHSDGAHEDLVVAEPDQSVVMAGFTWTSGTRTLSGAPNANYVEEFLERREREQHQLELVFRKSAAEPGHPSVAAALVIRAATDPSLGWWADVAGPSAENQRGPWLLGPPNAEPLVSVDLATGVVTSRLTGATANALEIAPPLEEPGSDLERTHEALRRLVRAHPTSGVNHSESLSDADTGRSGRPHEQAPPGARPAREVEYSATRPGSERLRIIHADWSMHPRKRVAALAARDDGSWTVTELGLWAEGPARKLLAGGRLIAGFDSPIGLPRAFAERARITSFRDVLPLLGKEGRWREFYDVCEERGEISLERPFYPRSAPKGSKRRRADLEDSLSLSYQDLLRECERATPTRPEASSLFWLIGAKQVGRAAISGWREGIAPALVRGVSLWPFDGDLFTLIEQGGPALAETYPAEFYGHFGLPGSGWSKRDQEGRRRMGAILSAWSSTHGVELASAVHEQVLDGFGKGADGEDAFDALVGALGMIRVIESGIDDCPADVAIRQVEGWILGQRAPTT